MTDGYAVKTAAVYCPSGGMTLTLFIASLFIVRWAFDASLNDAGGVRMMKCFNDDASLNDEESRCPKRVAALCLGTERTEIPERPERPEIRAMDKAYIISKITW